MGMATVRSERDGARGSVNLTAVADPSSGEILWVERRGGAPLQSPSLKQTEIVQ